MLKVVPLVYFNITSISVSKKIFFKEYTVLNRVLILWSRFITKVDQMERVTFKI